MALFPLFFLLFTSLFSQESSLICPGTPPESIGQAEKENCPVCLEELGLKTHFAINCKEKKSDKKSFKKNPSLPLSDGCPLILHKICIECFEELESQSKKLKCPLCRREWHGDYTARIPKFLAASYKLHGLSLKDKHLGKQDFINQDWSNLSFTRGKLSNGQYKNTHFRDILFKNCTFTNNSFTNCTFDKCTFDQCNFTNTTYNKCSMQKCKFTRSSLIGFKYHHSDSSYLSLTNTSLCQTSFKNSTLYKAFIKQCIFEGKNSLRNTNCRSFYFIENILSTRSLKAWNAILDKALLVQKDSYALAHLLSQAASIEKVRYEK